MVPIDSRDDEHSDQYDVQRTAPGSAHSTAAESMALDSGEKEAARSVLKLERYHLLVAAAYGAAIGGAVLLLVGVQLRADGGTAAFDKWRATYSATLARQEAAARRLAELVQKQKEPAFSVTVLEGCLQKYFPNGQFQRPHDERLMEQSEQIRSQLAEAANRDEVDSIVRKLYGEVECIVKGENWLKSDLHWSRTELKLYTDQSDIATADLKAASDELTKSTNDSDTFVALWYMGDKWYQKPFFRSSYDLLVMLLLLTMGFVGGMARLLRDYGNPNVPNPSRADYLVIPAVGSITAIAGFLLAKTGSLLLWSGEGEPSLSPYMIGLVGMVSGLLAKDMIAALEEKGHGLFKSAEEKTRHTIVSVQTGQKAAETVTTDTTGAVSEHEASRAAA